MNSNIRLLGLDLDGTVLNNEKQISNITEYKIREAMRRGIIIVPVTGRPKSGIPQSVKKIFRDSFIITSNGAVTTDQTGRDIESICMKADSVIKLLSILHKQKSDVQVEIFMNGYGYVEEQHLNLIKKRYKNTPLESYIEASRIPVEDLHKLIHDRRNDINEISVMTGSVSQKEKIHDMISVFADINISTSVKTDLEISDANAEKGNALIRLAQKLGIPESEIMACGDSGNDIEMIRKVGFGVAMGNADEGVKQIAKYVTLSNEENGVAYIIDKFILN